MAIGHYIRRGDQTTCGGVVLEGHPAYFMYGEPVARDGDAVSCGKDGKHYVIAGGIQSYVAGCLVAGTLDSVSTCPCNARLIYSLPNATYQCDRDSINAVNSVASVVPSSHLAAAPKRSNQVFSRSFAITDSSTGQPLVGRNFIALIDGLRMTGLTDANGIATVEAVAEDAVIEIHVVFRSPVRELTEFAEEVI